jgi:Yip1-like protein
VASATLEQAPEAPEKVNSFGRIVGVIFSPKQTFESIARRPNWLLPTILLSLITVGVVGAFGSREGAWRAYLERQVESSSRFQQLPLDQQQRTLDLQVKYAPRFAYGEVIVADFLVIVIIAAIFMGVFNMFVGTKLSFKTSLGVTAHAWVPFMISGLLATLVIFLKDPTTIDLQNPVASDVGSFLASGTSKWLVAMCHSFDLFSFWALGLFATGFSAAAPKKLSFGSALGWVIAVWLVYVLAKAGFTAAFS